MCDSIAVIAYSDDGEVLNAEFSVVQNAGQLAVVLESAGGRRSGTTIPRNSDYVPALRLLLARLQDMGAVVVSAVVASARLADRPEAERALLDEPVDLTAAVDLEVLRLRLTGGQGRVGQPPGASKEGNNRKRIMLRVAVPGWEPNDIGSLERYLSGGTPGGRADAVRYEVDDLLTDVTALVRYRTPGGDASLHKPLSLLWAISRIPEGKARLTRWPEFKREVGPLLSTFGGAESRATPQYPFWHLASSERLWEVHGVTDAPTSKDVAAAAGLTRPAAILLGDAAVRDRVVGLLVDEHLAGRVDTGRLGITLGLPNVARRAPHVRDVLRPLVGAEIATATGQTNMVLAMSHDTVVVRTEASPQEQQVPLREVQHGLNLLTANWTVQITVEDFGNSSEFIGAVLATLPQTLVTYDPIAVTLTEVSVETVTAGLAEADAGRTDGVRKAVFRREQVQLRELLAAGRKNAPCALCGEDYPIQFLIAAHVKRRATCTETERRDLKNIAMLACTFGCDALYEKGWISVDPTGNVCTAADVNSLSATVADRIKSFQGRRCTSHNEGSEPYFAWHRTTIFRHEPADPM